MGTGRERKKPDPGETSAQKIVHVTAVPNAIQRQHLGLMIHPKQDSIVTYPIFVKPFQIFREMPQREPERLRMLGQPLCLKDHTLSDGRVKTANIFLELRCDLYLVHSSRFKSSSGRVSP